MYVKDAYDYEACNTTLSGLSTGLFKLSSEKLCKTFKCFS